MTNRFVVKAFAALVLGFAMVSGVQAEDAARPQTPESCVVNGDKFAERKNAPISVTHNGESIYVCCKKCKKKFEQEPEKYIKAYKEELAKEKVAKAGR